MTDWPVHADIGGPIVLIGFGSIGKGVLPLIERHIGFDRSRFVVIDPSDKDRKLLDERGIRFIKTALTKDNYADVLKPLLTDGPGQGFCVNLSIDTSSLDIMELCRDLRVLYIDTVVEPWPGFYFDRNTGPAARTNYALRETILAAKRRRPGGTTAVSCCGANPGMVSWFVKQALLDVARDTARLGEEPKTREDWARLARVVGVKGIHIAERDTQRARHPKPRDVFVNTWSVEGFLSEGMQPAELGWGTHETWMPDNAREQKEGSRAAIFLLQPGANTRVRSWCPTPGPQYGFLVTHNEAISIPDYLTVREGERVLYRPTCHYAYHPCNDAVLSLHELFGRAGVVQERHEILTEQEIVDGIDELGVLLWARGERILVRLPALHRGDAKARALSECDGPPGDLRRPRRHGLGAREPRGGHRRSRRDGLQALSRRPEALSRTRRRSLHGLDSPEGPPRILRRRHRSVGPLAVPERAGALIRT
jgi:homospermidine synthase